MTTINPQVTAMGDAILPCLDAISRAGGQSVGMAACGGAWDQECRHWAIQHMGRIDTPRARALLLMHAADGSSPLQYWAVSNLSTDAARPILRALASRGGPMAEEALLKLGIIGNPTDVGFMLEVARTLSAKKWRGAAYAFEQMAELETLEPLRVLMGDQDPGVTRRLSEAAANAETKTLYRLGLVALENGDLGLAETLLERAAATNRTERAWFARVALARVHYLAGNHASAHAILEKVLEQPKNRAVDPRLILEARIGTIIVDRWHPAEQPDMALEWARVAKSLRARPEEEQQLLLHRYPEFMAIGLTALHDSALASERDSLASGLVARRSVR